MIWCDVFLVVHTAVVRLGYGLNALSMSTLAVIAVDRFLAIKTKEKYKLIVTKKRSFIAVLLLWIFPGTSVVIALHYKRYEDSDTVILTVIVVIFLLIITALYSSSFYLLKKIFSSISNTANQPSSNQPATEFNAWKYKRSLITMVMVLGMILVSFLPLLCVYSSSNLSELLYQPAALHFCESVVLLISTLNPIMYFWRMKDLRQALIRIIFHG
jgi:hypothetical protein